jgi:peptide/nickel transport system ATP-binding protein
MESVYKIYRVRKFLRAENVVAVEDFNIAINDDQPIVVTLAGESGSGKTTVAKMILRLEEPTKGVVRYRGVDLKRLRGEIWRRYRREVQAVFQDPYSAFNPLHRIETVLRIPLKRLGVATSNQEIDLIIRKSLEDVGLDPDKVLSKYPRQLSGGERQRVMIARAISLQPKLIVADEPVSMLDASIRASIINILKDLRDRKGVSILYITHDLNTAYGISDEIVIMYRGSIVEKGPAKKVLLEPLHPYTRLLIESLPKPRPTRKILKSREISIYEDTATPQHGCKFYPRCPLRMDKCLNKKPPLISVGDREVACYLYGE